MSDTHKPGVWYREDTLVYRLKEVEGFGRRRWSTPGVRALENDTAIRIHGRDAEAIAEQILTALRAHQDDATGAKRHQTGGDDA